MHLTKKDIEKLHRVQRLNMINGITGIKPANLIGTASSKNGSNLAIFSSIVHLGSDPALIGFIMRPAANIPRNTYQNILENRHYTINHVHESFIENAHYTSAKFNPEVSEFDACGLTEEFLYRFPAPFVKESRLKMGMEFIEEIPIPSNGTILIVGEIKELIVPDESFDDKGYIRLDKLYDVGISGLNSYYSLQRIASFPYARVTNVPDFNSVND